MTTNEATIKQAANGDIGMFSMFGIDWESNHKTGTRFADGVNGREFFGYSDGCEVRLWCFDDGTAAQD